MRVVKPARRAYRVGRPTNLEPYLVGFLEANNITCVEPTEDGGEYDGESAYGVGGDDDDGTGELTRSMNAAKISADGRRPPRRRRASESEAQVEESWLEGHSKPLLPPVQSSPQGLLRLPPRRGRNRDVRTRARSTSSHGTRRRYEVAAKHTHHVNQSTGNASEEEDAPNRTLLFQPPYSQLVENAEAFFATTELRCARRCLRTWLDKALALQTRRHEDYQRAMIHDKRMLVRQSLVVLSDHVKNTRAERERLAQLDAVLAYLLRKRNLVILAKAFSHWDESAKHQERVTSLAQMHMLKIKYFKQWRRIAAQNIERARAILTRKYVKLWRDRTARRLLDYEKAEARYEEALMMKCYKQLFFSFCSRQVEGVHERRFELDMLRTWRAQLQTIRNHQEQAAQIRKQSLQRTVFQTLKTRLHQRNVVAQRAQAHYNDALQSECLAVLRVQAKLQPRARQFAVTFDNNLKIKALRVWHLHLELSRQAAEVDRKRVLQSALTSWNDSLRCNTLIHHIDQRLVVESMYKWVVKRRLVQAVRDRNTKLVSSALTTWVSRLRQARWTLEDAEAAFYARQDQRRLRTGLRQLHAALRQREANQQSAIEFRNARALPHALEQWRSRLKHVQQLSKWATDARFYCLATKSLQVWKDQTREHQQQRRREAYRHIRARVKIRLVRSCFATWRSRAAQIGAMQAQADSLTQTRVVKIGTAAFDGMRQRSARHVEDHLLATSIDQRRLLISALAAFQQNHEQLVVLDNWAAEFHHESDLALLASLLKRLQWASFTYARQSENAEALLARNRDQHVRQMLKHWAHQALSRRRQKTEAAVERSHDAESPSLRPASRRAARSSDPRSNAFTSSPPDIYRQTPKSAVPAYLRTHGTPRRTGRFRPLPMPAQATPMAFDRAYYVTTPAPLVSLATATTAAEDLDAAADVFDALTPQITPFARKLRAGGVTPAAPTINTGGTKGALGAAPPSALRTSVLGRSVGFGGTGKSVRFAPASSRFSRDGGRRS